MEDEKFLSGYCRRTDSTRTVAVEISDGTIIHVDCSFDTCIYRQGCPIAAQIDSLIP